MLTKRGVSGIVTTSLIILIAITAAGIVFVGIRPIFNSLDGEFGDGTPGNTPGNAGATACYTNNLQVLSCTSNLTSNALQVQVRRGSSQNNITEVRLVFVMGSTRYTVPTDQVPGIFETITYTLVNSTLAQSEAVDVATILGSKSCDPSGVLVLCSHGVINEQVPLTGAPACSDNADNDGDGLGDYPLDPGCTGALDLNEEGDPARVESYAYAWAPIYYKSVNPIMNNIEPVYYFAPFAVDSNYPVASSVQAVTNFQLNQTPGRYAMLLFQYEPFHQVVGNNPNDTCINAAGTATAAGCIWLTSGVANASRMTDNFFKNLSEAGVPLNAVFIDYEKRFSIWGITNITTPSIAAQYYAIETDPRFSQPEPPLNKSIPQLLGFSNLSNVPSFFTSQDYLVWGNVMEHRIKHYLNEAWYLPVKRYYPHINASGYQEAARDVLDCAHPYPDGNGHGGYCNNTWPGANEDLLGYYGTHQGPELYGGLGSITWPGRFQRTSGLPIYTNTPFNAFKWATNQFRQPALIDNAPLVPWVGFRSWVGDLGDGEIWNLKMGSTDYFQELILHVLSSDVDALFYWNPKYYQQGHPNDLAFQTGGATTQDDLVVSRAMHEFDVVAGFTDKTRRFTTLTNWSSDYAITRIDSGNRKVSRFTPHIDGGMFGTSAYGTVRAENDTGVYLETGEHTLYFPEAVIYRPSQPVSAYGLWIVQPLSAGDPSVVKVNSAPVVIAGFDWTVNLTLGEVARPVGSVNDFGDSSLVIEGWNVSLGNSRAVNISNSLALNPTINISTPGLYELQLHARDNRTRRYDNVYVRVVR